MIKIIILKRNVCVHACVHACVRGWMIDMPTPRFSDEVS